MTDRILITLNGESKAVDAGLSIDRLLSELELPRDRIAVELNRRVVRRTDWPDHVIEDGDRVEIVHFVGGG